MVFLFFLWSDFWGFGLVKAMNETSSLLAIQRIENQTKNKFLVVFAQPDTFTFADTVSDIKNKIQHRSGIKTYQIADFDEQKERRIGGVHGVFGLSPVPYQLLLVDQDNDHVYWVFFTIIKRITNTIDVRAAIYKAVEGAPVPIVRRQFHFAVDNAENVYDQHLFEIILKGDELCKSEFDDTIAIAPHAK